MPARKQAFSPVSQSLSFQTQKFQTRSCSCSCRASLRPSEIRSPWSSGLHSPCRCKHGDALPCRCELALFMVLTLITATASYLHISADPLPRPELCSCQEITMNIFVCCIRECIATRLEYLNPAAVQQIQPMTAGMLPRGDSQPAQLAAGTLAAMAHLPPLRWACSRCTTLQFTSWQHHPYNDDSMTTATMLDSHRCLSGWCPSMRAQERCEHSCCLRPHLVKRCASSLDSPDNHTPRQCTGTTMLMSSSYPHACGMHKGARDTTKYSTAQGAAHATTAAAAPPGEGTAEGSRGPAAARSPAAGGTRGAQSPAAACPGETASGCRHKALATCLTVLRQPCNSLTINGSAVLWNHLTHSRASSGNTLTHSIVQRSACLEVRGARRTHPRGRRHAGAAGKETGWRHAGAGARWRHPRGRHTRAGRPPGEERRGPARTRHAPGHARSGRSTTCQRT